MSGPTPPRRGEHPGRPGVTCADSPRTTPDNPPTSSGQADNPGQDRTVTLPLAAFDGLVKVAVHVSYGRRAAFSVGPYPDSTARVALGALDDVGLLDAYRQRHPEAGE